jgi:hypothetical protein
LCNNRSSVIIATSDINICCEKKERIIVENGIQNE